MDKLIEILNETNQILNQHFGNSTLEIISIVISGLALLFAIFLPVRIANKQNKIALFEKRMSAYADLLKLKAFSDLLKRNECSFDPKIIATVGVGFEGEKYRRCGEVITNFQAFFYSGDHKPNGSDVARVTIYTIRNLELSLQSLPMLYSKCLKNEGADANKEITKIFEDLSQFMSSLTAPCGPQNDQHRVAFVSNMDVFFDKYADVFEKGIRL